VKPIESDKKLFREEIRRKLNELSSNEFEHNSLALSENLFRYLNQQNVIHQSMGVFAPFEKEPLWYKSFDVEKLKTSFPSIDENKQMVFRVSKLSELIVLSDFGSKILGPIKSNQVIVPDLILMPGLAFTKNGKRLGRGKGFFDRYLENFQGIKIAIGFESQVLDEIPTDIHDIKYDLLITEKNIYKK
jgi:5-formyltetrahydrofolate cyclo-ligase